VAQSGPTLIIRVFSFGTFPTSIRHENPAQTSCLTGYSKCIPIIKDGIFFDSTRAFAILTEHSVVNSPNPESNNE